jgi:hypothetical protein
MRYRGARELAALVGQASRTELEQLVRQLAGGGHTDRHIGAATGLGVELVRQALAGYVETYDEPAP